MFNGLDEINNVLFQSMTSHLQRVSQLIKCKILIRHSLECTGKYIDILYVAHNVLR